MREYAIYWTNNYTGTIGRANRNGTGINQSFITGAQNLIAVTVHGDYIYWTNVGPGGLGKTPIGRARPDGAHVEQNFITAGGPAGVAALLATLEGRRDCQEYFLQRCRFGNPNDYVSAELSR